MPPNLFKIQNHGGDSMHVSRNHEDNHYPQFFNPFEILTFLSELFCRACKPRFLLIIGLQKTVRLSPAIGLQKTVRLQKTGRLLPASSCAASSCAATGCAASTGMSAASDSAD